MVEGNKPILHLTGNPVMTPPRRRGTARDHRGLAMFDVLLGMAIFALLAVIAVQSMGMFRERTYVTRAVSDAKQISVGIEAHRIHEDAYPETVASNGAGVRGVNLTVGSRIAGYYADEDGFRICVLSSAGVIVKAYAIYDSDSGAIVDSGRGNHVSDCDGTGVEAGPADPSTTPTNVTATVIPGDVDAIITWDEVVGATNYALYLDGSTIPVATGASRNVELTSVPPGDHTVTVSATVDGTEGPKSAPATFTIECDNDMIACAHPINLAPSGAPWTSRDYDNHLKTGETGEGANSTLGMWWKLTSPRTVTVTVSVVAASDGSALYRNPGIYMWKSTATTVGALNTPVAQRSASGDQPSLVVPLQKGESYLIRTSSASTNWHSGYRLRVSPGPFNDAFEDAIEISGVTPAATSYTADIDNTFAGPQPGEPTNSGGSTWWKFTPTRTASHRVVVSQASDGSTLFYQPNIDVWDTTTDDVATLPATPTAHDRSGNKPYFSTWMEAGHTYKIRVASASPNWRSMYRLAVTPGPVGDPFSEAADIPAMAAGQTWVSADMDNRFAEAEPGESTTGGGSLWWTFVAPRAGTFNFTTLTATDGSPKGTPIVHVYRTSAATITGIGNATSNANVALTAGQEVKIRVLTATENHRGKFRLQVRSP